MSKSELHDWECEIEELSGNNADKMLGIARDIYKTAFVRGRNSMTWEQTRWIPCSEKLPEIDEDGYSSYVLVSFSNFTLPCIGQLRKTDGENHWYEGDDEKAIDSFGLHVNAWMPLPDPYKAESEDKE